MYHNFKKQVGSFLLFLCMASLLIVASPTRALCKKEHLVHFPNTAYELNIYKIYGKRPGKTLMLIGGIQGNEPGGFLSADHYADMRLEKGNLIVVPRANFYSIILNHRGPNGDMNRKFAHEDSSYSMEDKIVSILKKLISESDYLLNLHDGAGYYYPRYINKWRNPRRFGQAIIADTDRYEVPGTNKVINLGEMAQKVLAEVNAHIKNDLYKFRFMNTKTGDADSRHREQKKSASYFALTKHQIPAFGVETSKFLPSVDLKVRYHNLVINAFMKLFNIIPQSPGLFLDPPSLKYLVVSVNGHVPVVIKKNQTINVVKGDSINVSHIESNYERGLSLDILGYGDLNDYHRELKILRNTSIIVRKDNHKFAEIPIKISGERIGERARAGGVRQIDYFVMETKDHRVLVSNGETLELVRGEKLRIVNVLPSMPKASNVKVNFKGFVGDWNNNTGEDRGYTIDTGADLITRYSLYKKGAHYEILATHGSRVLGRMVVRLTPPRMDYLVLRVNNRKHILLRSEDAISLSRNDDIFLEEIQTNLHNRADIHLHINGHRIKPGEMGKLRKLCSAAKHSNQEVRIKKGPLLLGKVFINVN